MSSNNTIKNKKILFLGPLGTYSHQAALQQFSHFDDIEYIPSPSIPECFDQLETNTDISYSVVPLENSTNGQVVFSYDIFRDRMLDDSCKIVKNRVIPKFEVVGEQYVSITHCLLCPDSNVTLEDLGSYKQVRIFSHPQVWGQVANYLKKLRTTYPNTKFEIVDSSSTSSATLRAVEEQKSFDTDSKELLNISIAGETAAHLYNVNVLAQAINDRLGNTTRFLILKRIEDPPLKSSDPNKMEVSLLMFTIGLDDPGSLVDVLNILKEHKVNMSSISSRPYTNNEDNRKWQYIFYVEYNFDSNKKNWDIFYEEINEKCSKWCLWGTFPRNERYYQ